MSVSADAVPTEIDELTAWVSASGDGRGGSTFYVTGKLRQGGTVTLAGAFDTDDFSAIRALTLALARAVDAIGPDRGGPVRIAVAWPCSTPAIPSCNARAESGADGDGAVTASRVVRPS